MPVYEYECSNCGHRVEMIQRFSDPPLEECEICHGKMKKLISQCTFHLKGTGWYVTDYGSSSSNKSANSTSAKSSNSETTSKKEGSSSKKES